MRTKLLGAATLVALALGALAPSARAQTTVDPDGADATLPPIPGVTGFDVAVGNALALGAAPLTPASEGSTFTLLYQAVISQLIFSGGVQAPIPGADSTANGTFTNSIFPFTPFNFELTVVAQIQEQVTSVMGATGTSNASVSFQLDENQAGSYFRIYYDKPGATANSGPLVGGLNQPANNSPGTGFSNGILVLEAVPDSGAPNTSNFDVNGTGPPIGNLNNSGSGTFPGVQSVLGGGETNFLANVIYANPLFFTGGTPTVIGLTFETSQKTPFAEAAPSTSFTQGTGGGTGNFGGETYASIPTAVGNTNGVSGPNFLFQADANFSFGVAAVPEPGTMSMAVTALGLVSLTQLRSYRRRTKSSAA